MDAVLLAKMFTDTCCIVGKFRSAYTCHCLLQAWLVEHKLEAKKSQMHAAIEMNMMTHEHDIQCDNWLGPKHVTR